MNLRAEPVTAENRPAVLGLEVAGEQRGFIETTAECLAEADALSLWRPVGLYDGETLVGFAMYGLFPREGTAGRIWLDRLLIDRRYQGRGYGTAAMGLLLDRLHQEYGEGEIYLSLYEDNQAALRLYERFGFSKNGEDDLHGEKVMVLPQGKREVHRN